MTHRRVVVGLGAATARRELEAAATLAGRIDAELVGLFVEDAELLRFAALPFAHEIGFASAQRRRLEVPALERAMRAHAADAERTLAGTAGRTALRWSFRVARGVVAVELIAAATGRIDPEGALRLLLLGDGGSPVTRWAEEACASFAQGEAAARPELVRAANLAELAAELRGGASGVLVLRAEESLLSQQGLQDLLHETAVPVLVLPTRGP
jgi:hypothetical protein